MGRGKRFFRNVWTFITKPRKRENIWRSKFMKDLSQDSMGSYEGSIYHNVDVVNVSSSESGVKSGGNTRTLTSDELIVHRADEHEPHNKILLFGVSDALILHTAEIGKGMDFLWNSNEMCDVKIHVDNVVYHAHRFVLSCFSSKFLDFFTELKWKGGGLIPVKISNYSSNAFQVFLKFAYKGALDVNSDLISEVIAMADEMNIPSLKKRCLNFLDDMSLEDTVELLIGKRLPSNSEQFRSAVYRISKEFPLVYYYERFLKLDVATVGQILSNDDLKVSSEMEVFQMVLKWINYSLEERRQYLSSLLKLVRFPYMSQKELFKCLQTTNLLRGCSEIFEIIKDANWVITARELDQDDPLNIDISPARNSYSQKP